MCSPIFFRGFFLIFSFFLFFPFFLFAFLSFFTIFFCFVRFLPAFFDLPFFSFFSHEHKSHRLQGILHGVLLQNNVNYIWLEKVRFLRILHKISTRILALFVIYIFLGKPHDQIPKYIIYRSYFFSE